MGRYSKIPNTNQAFTAEMVNLRDIRGTFAPGTKEYIQVSNRIAYMRRRKEACVVVQSPDHLIKTDPTYPYPREPEPIQPLDSGFADLGKEP